MSKSIKRIHDIVKHFLCSFLDPLIVIFKPGQNNKHVCIRIRLFLVNLYRHTTSYGRISLPHARRHFSSFHYQLTNFIFSQSNQLPLSRTSVLEILYQILKQRTSVRYKNKDSNYYAIMYIDYL